MLAATGSIGGQRYIDLGSAVGDLPSRGVRAQVQEVLSGNHLCVRRNLRKRSEPTGAHELEVALQFFGGGGGAEIAPVDEAISSTAFRKFFHFAPPTWSEFAWSLTASDGACNLRKGFATADRYAVWNALINWSR